MQRAALGYTIDFWKSHKHEIFLRGRWDGPTYRKIEWVQTSGMVFWGLVCSHSQNIALVNSQQVCTLLLVERSRWGQANMHMLANMV